MDLSGRLALLVLTQDGVCRSDCLLGAVSIHEVYVGAGCTLLRNAGLQLEVLASERMGANMVHPAGLLHLHGPRDSHQLNTVWKLVCWDEWNDVSIAARDEVAQPWRLRRQRGTIVFLSGCHGRRSLDGKMVLDIEMSFLLLDESV